MNSLLTIDELALRWRIETKRAWKYARLGNLKAINFGTPKNPELRFRLAAVEAWEASVEQELNPPEAEGAILSTQGKAKQVAGELYAAIGSYRGRRVHSAPTTAPNGDLPG